MGDDLDAFRAKFRVAELGITATPAWTWSLRPAQSTLGAGVLALRRRAHRFAEITAEEGAELSRILATVETTLGRAFAFDKINYLMLMMVDAHVHFHVLPRYAGNRRFAGMTWDDLGWPGPPRLDGPEPGASTLHAIRDRLVSLAP